MIYAIVHILFCHLADDLRHDLLVGALPIAQNVFKSCLTSKRLDFAEHVLDGVQIRT